MGGLPATSVITAPHSTLRRVKIAAAGLGQPARRAPAPKSAPAPAIARRRRQQQRPHRRVFESPRARGKQPSASEGHCFSIAATAAALRPITITITTVASASLSRPYQGRGSTVCLKSRATSAQAHPDGRIFSAFTSDAPSDPNHLNLLRNRRPHPSFPNCLTSDGQGHQLAGLLAIGALDDASTFAPLHPEPLELQPGSSRPRAASTAASAASRKRLRTLASHLRHCHRPP